MFIAAAGFDVGLVPAATGLERQVSNSILHLSGYFQLSSLLLNMPSAKWG